MRIEISRVGAGHATTRTRWGGGVERTWVRPVTLRCTDIESPRALAAAAELLPDASKPVRSAQGGWEIVLTMEVRESWENEEITGSRARGALNAAYDKERRFVAR